MGGFGTGAGVTRAAGADNTRPRPLGLGENGTSGKADKVLRIFECRAFALGVIIDEGPTPAEARVFVEIAEEATDTLSRLASSSDSGGRTGAGDDTRANKGVAAEGREGGESSSLSLSKNPPPPSHELKTERTSIGLLCRASRYDIW